MHKNRNKNNKKYLLLFMCILVFTCILCTQITFFAHDSCIYVPKQYKEIIKKSGNICPNVNADIIATLVEHESKWNNNAISQVGAKGIVQFLPSTFKTVGIDADGDGKADINNPKDTIYSAANWLCQLDAQMQKNIDSGKVTGNSLELALAAYNAGPNAVLKYGGIPPFSETQNYVTNIIEHAHLPRCK